MQTEITQKQADQLREIATKVISDFTSLDITEIINRIHFITGRDMGRCIAGFRMMQSQKMFPENFVISLEKLPKIESMVSKIFPLVDALELEFVDAKTSEKNAAMNHVSLSEKHVSDGPTDDPDEVDEPAPKRMISSLQLDANF